MGAPWWHNDKLGPLDNAMEIRGHHFDDMMRKCGALDDAMENLGPFDDTTGELETLDKAMGKLGG